MKHNFFSSLILSSFFLIAGRAYCAGTSKISNGQVITAIVMPVDYNSFRCYTEFFILKKDEIECVLLKGCLNKNAIRNKQQPCECDRASAAGCLLPGKTQAIESGNLLGLINEQEDSMTGDGEKNEAKKNNLGQSGSKYMRTGNSRDIYYKSHNKTEHSFVCLKSVYYLMMSMVLKI